MAFLVNLINNPSVKAPLCNILATFNRILLQARASAR
jgi:hypothetical protein